MPPVARRAVPWDIYKEHFEEAAFLWGEWEDALVAANYALDDVAVGPELRLLAHLDGLVLGGRPVAQELLLPALSGDEPGSVAAAAWALVQAEHAANAGGDDYQNAVIDALVTGEPPARAAIARALRLSAKADLSRVARLWSQGSPEVRAVVFELLTVGEPGWGHEHLESTLGSGDSKSLAAALRALRKTPNQALARYVQDALGSEASEVRREAMATGIVLGLQPAWEACRRAAILGGDGCRVPLALLATSNRPADRAVVLALARDSAVRRHAIWALGFAGDVEAAQVLVDATGDDVVAKVAGEALAAITGITIDGELATPGKTRGPNVDEVGDDDPPPVVRTEDHLPLPNPAAVKNWWQGERGRFAPGARHIQGQARTPEAIRGALATAPMWRREVMWLEVAAATNTAPTVDLRSWTSDQARALRAPAPSPRPVARGR